MTTETIHLEPSQVPATLRGSYSGKSFQVRVVERVTVPAHAGLWDGGSRSTYSAVRIADGAGLPVSDNASAPWDKSRRDSVVDLRPGIAVIEHRIFCGKDMGLRIYVHPADAAPMLPSKPDLSPVERLVLEYTATRKSSYMGKDRFAMAIDDLQRDRRYGHDSDPVRKAITRLDRSMWDSAKESLIARGLLNKAGAITVAGRNAR